MTRASRIGLCVAALALALAGAPPASALAAGPEVVRDGDTLIVTGGATAESITISAATGGRLAVTGVQLGRRRDPALLRLERLLAACSNPASVEIRLGAGDDDLRTSGITLPMVIDDGPGDDEVEHGYGPATFLNGEGDDRFEGDGDDLFLSGPGADTFRGGRGNDVVSYAAETRPVQIDVTAPGGDGAPARATRSTRGSRASKAAAPTT